MANISCQRAATRRAAFSRSNRRVQKSTSVCFFQWYLKELIFSESSCAENPFQYWYYEAIFSLGAAINRTLAEGGDPYNGTHLLQFFKNGKLELQHQVGWFPDQTERINKYFNELMELDVTFSVSQFFSPSLFGSGSKQSAREIPKCFKNRPQDNDWILNSDEGRKCVEEKGTNIQSCWKSDHLVERSRVNINIRSSSRAKVY
jgi:hypothetical protein